MHPEGQPEAETPLRPRHPFQLPRVAGGLEEYGTIGSEKVINGICVRPVESSIEPPLIGVRAAVVWI